MVITIKNNYEFRRLYSKGKSAAVPELVVYCRRNRYGYNRVGFTVSNKLGKAVRRNKIRRRLREIYRLNAHRLSSGYDIVVVARHKSAVSAYAQLNNSFLNTCRRLGLIKAERTNGDAQ